MILTTLVFAVVIGCGAGAYALMQPGMSPKGEGMSYASSSFSWRGGNHEDHHDHDDDD